MLFKSNPNFVRPSLLFSVSCGISFMVIATLALVTCSYLASVGAYPSGSLLLAAFMLIMVGAVSPILWFSSFIDLQIIEIHLAGNPLGLIVASALPFFFYGILFSGDVFKGWRISGSYWPIVVRHVFGIIIVQTVGFAIYYAFHLGS